MAYHSNKQNNEENPYNDRQESGDVRTRYKFDENSWRRFSHNTNNSHKWNEKYQGQGNYQSKRAQSSQSNNYGWHKNHHNNNNNAYGHGNNRFGKNYTKYNKHNNNNNNNNNEKSNAGNGNWNGNNRREKEEKDDFFIALNDKNKNDKLNQFCVQKSILTRENDTFMKQLHYISSQFYLIDFVGINVNTNSKDKNASVNIRYKDENGQKMIPNSLRQDSYDDSNFYFDNANEFMKNVFDMSQTVKELKESNITWNDVFEQNGKISNEWKLDNLDNAFLRESFSVVNSGHPTYTMCIQKAINELYNHIRENQNESQNDEKNENCEKFQNIDIITTRQPLRRMVDFLLWKKAQSNPKFIIIKQNVNNNNNNNKSKSKSKSILQFYPIWDELEQINEQKYNEKMFGKKKNSSNGTAFGKLFYGDMLERCMAEETKDKKISLKEWIKEYNYKRKEECGESIKALSILSFLKNSQQSINILLLNEIDMIIPYKDSAKFESDYQRCELKAMVNGYHAGQMLDHFGQAKLSGNDFILAGIRTVAHGNGKNNDGTNNGCSYLDTLKTIECYQMNDLLMGAQDALPREYQNDGSITVNEQFIDNVYYSILQWIVDNILKNEQIKDGDCILCDYNKIDETLYLKQLPQVTEQLSKMLSNDKNESFGFLCDKNARKITIKNTNRISVNLNDLKNEAKAQKDEIEQLENMMNCLGID